MERTIQTETMDETIEILRGVRLLNPITNFDEVVDVAVSKDSIKWIKIASGKSSGLWLIPGLVDMHVHLRTPGYEEAETLETGLKAAIAGGVTCVGMMPNTSPPLDSAELAVVLKLQGESLGLSAIEPIPCVTKDRAGLQCVNFQEFAKSGISCFSDDGSPVQSDEALNEAFSSLALFNGLVIEHPEVSSMAAGGAVNLGRASRETGTQGIPESAEFLDVKRCINILRKCSGGRLHLTHLSSPESIRLVHEAFLNGLDVTCDVTPHHLVLNEQEVIDSGPIAKMNPPLRSEESRKKILEMMKSGFVTAVASDHAPHPHSKKTLPLSSAAFGIIGLETMLPLTVDVLLREAGMSPLDIIRLLTTGPASVINTVVPDVDVNKPLNMVLFDPQRKWLYSDTFSKSSNTPFLGQMLTGRVLRVWLKHELFREGEFV